jgi:hypothetical protein
MKGHVVRIGTMNVYCVLAGIPRSKRLEIDIKIIVKWICVREVD